MDYQVGDIVGVFGDNSVWKIIEDIGDRFLLRDSKNQEISTYKSSILPPRVGPFQIEKEKAGISIFNISGYTVNLENKIIMNDGDMIVASPEIADKLIADALLLDYDDHAREQWDYLTSSFFGDSEPVDPCLLKGHSWVDTGMRISYCRRCEARGEYDMELGSYRYSGQQGNGY